MRDRNEKTPEAASAGLVPIPIEIFDVIRAARWKRLSESWRPVGENKRFRSWAVVGTRFGVAWDPVEMHYFWRRMLGNDEK